MRSEILVELRPSWRVSGKEIFLFNRDDVGQAFIYQATPDGDLVANKYVPGVEPKPTLILPDEVLQAFAEALLKGGYKPKDQSRVEGVLEAQSKHLEDMRFLLKLPALPVVIGK